MWMNVACLVGRATAEPKARETAGGTRYATLRIAVPRGRGETDFFTVELWGKLAAVAHTHVHKNTILTLRCEMRQQAWTADGQRRERLVLVARSLGVVRAALDDANDDDAEFGDAGMEIAA
jgi:single-strand DNA-binding protein